MPLNEPPPKPSPEREQTDASLQVEREVADDALESELTVIDETADAIVSKARARADEVLLATRTKTDQHSGTGAASAQPPGSVLRERVREDQTLKDERADADEALRVERADQVALLAAERDETEESHGERIWAESTPSKGSTFCFTLPTHVVP